MRTALLLLSFVSLTFAQNPSATIKALREQSNRAILEADLKGFAATLAPDFLMVRGNGAAVSSRQAYIDLFAEDFRDPASVRYQRITDKIELSSVSPLAAEHGHWVGILRNGKHAYTGTYLAMWRRSGDTWQIRSELFVVLACEDPATCSGYANGSK